MQFRLTASGEQCRRLGAILLALAIVGVTPAPLAAATQLPRRPAGAGALATAPGVVGQSVALRVSAAGVLNANPLTQTGAPLAVATAFRYDLYRPGEYTMQATWWYCTAASVQIMRNVDRETSDHSTAAQTRYFTYMRAHNMHRMPATDGIDPPGFLAGLRAFVDERYRLVASSTFDNAVRSAVMRLRSTAMPVALIVNEGRHAWVLTGFTATADPARTASFRVLTVRVTGPLYGRQSRNGYDPRPDTPLSIAAFRRYLTPYDFKYGPTPWDDRFVTFQVV